uniref:Putative reverse transcriptase and intron maturase n=1 Tax=Rhexinema sarcinoideum TaxID=43261 RepID=A0A1B2RYQ6_9CHLO|nr:putative reverse transcriptase and intron maturase [Rhexinema sarcinoideum]
MSKLEQLVAISKLSQKNTKWIHRDIFRILHKNELWIAAYEKLKSNKEALTPGCAPETMDGMSLERLQRLKEQVGLEKFNFKKVKQISIQKTDGKTRPLGIPTANDKIVQEAMRMILEAIYEPIFSKQSFGFRPGLGCHDALAHVERKFRWVDYVIENDIEQAYPTINHHVLVNILKKRIDDPRFIRLIWKLLGCGTFSEKDLKGSQTGVPQGSVVSPILANIYYHELDEFVQGLIEQYTTPETSKKKQKSSTYKSLEYRISKIHKEMKTFKPQSRERQKLAKTLKSLRKERFKVEGQKLKVIRIEYVRYADDWMIGVAGDSSLTFQIKKEVGTFIKNSLKQNLHPVKTKITNIRIGNVKFLGYLIFLPQNRSISSYKGKGVQTIRRGQPQLRFDIPVAEVTKKYSERGYFKKLEKGVRPISRASYTILEDHVIVNHYRSLWLGLLNYYSGCTKRGRLQYFHYLFHMSCAMTLGHRHRRSSSEIFQKYGKKLTVQILNKGKTIEFPYKSTWRLSERKWLLGEGVKMPTHHYANLISRSSLGLPCAICDKVPSKCIM